MLDKTTLKTLILLIMAVNLGLLLFVGYRQSAQRLISENLAQGKEEEVAAVISAAVAGVNRSDKSSGTDEEGAGVAECVCTETGFVQPRSSGFY